MKPALSTKDVELAVAEFIGWRKKMIIPNISWGLGFGHELDLCIVSDAGYCAEVEIKVSASDLRADLNKKHLHFDPRIQYLWFAMPATIADSHEHLVPPVAGIYAVDDMGRVTIRRAAIKQPARKLTADERYHLGKLAAMRIWKMKKRSKKGVTK